MKKIMVLLLLLMTINTQAQTETEAQPQPQPQSLQTIHYDGSFMQFEPGFSEARKAGVIGEQVTLVDVGYYFIFENQRALENNKFINAEDAHMFRNKTFVVTDYSYQKPDDILTIKNENGTFLWKISDLSTYVFNRYLDTLKSNLEGKKFIPLYYGEKLRSVDGQVLDFWTDQTFSISKVRFTTIKHKYLVLVTVNGTYHFVYPTGEQEQPGKLKGEIYKRYRNWINIQSNEPNRSTVTLIEEKTFNKFAEKNKDIIKDIRSRKVKVEHN